MILFKCTNLDKMCQIYAVYNLLTEFLNKASAKKSDTVNRDKFGYLCKTDNKE